MIGFELYNKTELEWVLNNKNKTINGFSMLFILEYYNINE